MGNRKATRSVLALTIPVVALGWHSNALAQAARKTTDAAAASELTEIIVTANKREQNLVDVPAAVTAVSGDVLNERNLTQIEDFAAQVPGFSIQNVGRTGLRMVLRGQNTGGAGASVATMVDDVVLNTASANTNGSTTTPNFDTFDIERVEVLRGPQGTLYGATAQGGLLKYVTKKPQLDKFGSDVELGASTVKDGGTGWSAKGVVNLPFASGTAAVRIMGYHNNVPGYIDNLLIGRKDVNKGKQDGGRIAFLWAPTDSLKLLLTAFKQKQTYDAEGLAQVAGAPQVPGSETDASYRLSTGKPITNKLYPGGVVSSYEYYNGVLDYDFSVATFTSSTSLVKGKSFLGFDASDSPAGPGVTLATAFGPLFGQPIVVPLSQHNDHRKFNQEFRLASKNDSGPFWQVGAFYSDEKITFDQYLDARSTDLTQSLRVLPFIPGIGGLPLGGSILPATYKEISGFGDVTFKFAQRFEVSVGGRYTHNKQTSLVINDVGLIGGGPTAIVNPETRSSESKFTYSVAPRLILSKDLSLYARVASGYRPGGPVQAIPGAPPDFPNSFKSDNTVNYELGLKGIVADNRLSFDVALYQINWTDAQIISAFFSQANSQTYSVTTNAGRARSRGAEWNFDYRPVAGLTFGWNGSYTDAKITSDAPGLGAVNGDELPFVPKFSSTLNVDYSFPLSGDLRMNVGGGWSHVGERFGGFSNVPTITSNHSRLPSYDTVDLRAGVEFSNYRVDLTVRNLNNSHGVLDYQNPAGYQGQFAQAAILTPRTFGLRLSAHF